MACSDRFYQTFAANITRGNRYLHHLNNNYVWDFTVDLEKPLDFRNGDWEVCLSHCSIPGDFFNDFYCENQHLFLHCELLENNDKLNKKDSFDIIPLSSNYKEGPLCFYSPKHPRYIPVKPQKFDTVRFYTTDINGEKINIQFKRSTFVCSTLVRLHFRKRKTCECVENLQEAIANLQPDFNNPLLARTPPTYEAILVHTPPPAYEDLNPPQDDTTTASVSSDVPNSFDSRAFPPGYENLNPPKEDTTTGTTSRDVLNSHDLRMSPPAYDDSTTITISSDVLNSFDS